MNIAGHRVLGLISNRNKTTQRMPPKAKYTFDLILHQILKSSNIFLKHRPNPRNKDLKLIGTTRRQMHSPLPNPLAKLSVKDASSCRKETLYTKASHSTSNTHWILMTLLRNRNTLPANVPKRRISLRIQNLASSLILTENNLILKGATLIIPAGAPTPATYLNTITPLFMLQTSKYS